MQKATRRNNDTGKREDNTTVLFSSTVSETRATKNNVDSNHRFLAGYVLSGVASSLLTTIFGLFHVDVFLRIHKLPLSAFATGNVVFSIVNTANDLAGAWLVDSMAAQQIPKSQLVGLSGILFALCFTTLFFPWHLRIGTFWHFVLSLSLYDTMYSFMAILLGSIVTDNHEMSERDRVRFLASGKIVNLLGSFAVARIGLAAMMDPTDKDTEDSTRTFRLFVVCLALIVSILFCVAQFLMTTPGNPFSWRTIICFTSTPTKEKKPRLQLGRIIRVFWNHTNFRAWIGMEMLLECQFNFLTSFTKTLVDRLVLDRNGLLLFWTRQNCDWFLSMLRPATQVASILAYIPVQKLGYKRLYTTMFATNLVLSCVCLCFASPDSTTWIVMFLSIYTIVTGAVSSSGFHLAMSDMVLEAKVKHRNDPSLAGLFMGANALMCKPMDSLLPIVAAHFLKTTNFQKTQEDNSSIMLTVHNEDSELVLFRLLLIPPLLFSMLQLASWSTYTLNPKRIEELRNQLKQLEGDERGIDP